jgi:hypothetical protein
VTVVPAHEVGALAHYSQPGAGTVVQYVTPPVDSWIQAFGEIVKLAEYIARTSFVPDGMRGDPAAVAAAILAGREAGVDPMTALQNFDVIKGKPAMKPVLMRALVQAQGHEIRYVETSDTKVVVEGRRRGSDDWTRVTFTAQQARNAKIDLGGYPEDKLVARATSRLCKRHFGDVIAGMPYSTDEAEDLDEALVPAAARRPITPAEAQAAPAAADAGRALAGQLFERVAAAQSADDLNEVAGEIKAAAGSLTPEAVAELRAAWAARKQALPADQKALKRMHTALSALGLDDAQRKVAAGNVVGREIASTSELTGAEADTVWKRADEAMKEGGAASLLYPTDAPAGGPPGHSWDDELQQWIPDDAGVYPEEFAGGAQ